MHVEDHVLLVALGIDTVGAKHVLGVREGATENATACTALLTDIVERGLATDRAILAVLDGAKALAKAVRNVCGNRAIIQRCQVHKLRNVLDHLPDARAFHSAQSRLVASGGRPRPSSTSSGVMPGRMRSASC